MVETLFLESVSERHRVGPLAPHLNAFASLLWERGYSDYSLKLKLRLVGKFSRWLDQKGLGVNAIGMELFDLFIGDQGTVDPVRRGDLASLKLLLKHLNGPGVILSSPTTRADDDPFRQIKSGFALYLSHERGLSPETIATYIALTKRFCTDCLKSGMARPAQLCPKDITAFLLSYTQSVKRTSAKLMVTSLRTFLRYLYVRGETTTDLSVSVPGISDWRLSGLPKSLEPEQVESLLHSCDRGTKVGQRDYSILLLLARLGLRAGEIVKMTLDGINWDAGELVVRGKGPREDRMPLPHGVGEALAVYLQHGRPSCRSRRVFIRARAPYEGFSSSVAICNVVQRALARSRIESNHKGAHLLRHSLATNMLREGASLTEIGEVLRHKLPGTTEIYTKVDIAALRPIAQPWMGGEI